MKYIPQNHDIDIAFDEFNRNSKLWYYCTWQEILTHEPEYYCVTHNTNFPAMKSNIKIRNSPIWNNFSNINETFTKHYEIVDPAIMYVKISTYREYLEENSLENQTRNFITIPDVAPTGKRYISKVGGEWTDAILDCICITQIKFYNNSNDGSISIENQRAELKYLHLVKEMSSTYGGSNNSTIVTSPIEINAISQYYIDTELKTCSSLSGDIMLSGNSEFHFSSLFDWLNKFTENSVVGCRTVLLDGFTTDTYRERDVVWESKNYLTNFLNTLGIPWTYDENDAKTKNTSKFKDYSEKGPQPFPNGNQPKNPTGGGMGNGDDSSDFIDIPSTPSVKGGVSVRAYAMDLSHALSIKDVLWNVNYFSDKEKLYTSPGEAIIGLKIFPYTFNVPTDYETVVCGDTVMQATVNDVIKTISGKPIPANYFNDTQINMGELQITEYFGSFLDYDPYTSLTLYMPYIGFKDLSCSDFMGKKLKLKYLVDIYSGACTAIIYANDKIITTDKGTIGIEIPLCSSTKAIAEISSEIAKNTNTIGGITSIGALATGVATGNPIILAGGLANTLGTFNNMQKTQISSRQFQTSKSGNLGNNGTSLDCVQTPYIIVQRPVTAFPENIGSQEGYASSYGGSISSFTGFLQIENVKLDNVSCTETEKAEITALLKSGVYLT